MNITRRTFFKLIAAVGAMNIVPIKAISEVAPMPKAATLIGMMREMRGYEPAKDAWYVRYDVMCKERSGEKIQFFVTMIMANGFTEEELESARKPAIQCLEEEITKRGLSARDFVPFPTSAWRKAA